MANDNSPAAYHIDWSTVPERTGISGFPVRVVNGERLQLALIELPAGFSNAPHSHPGEQAGYVLAGTIEYIIEDVTILCRTGDSYCIPPGKNPRDPGAAGCTGPAAGVFLPAAPGIHVEDTRSGAE